MSVSTSQTIEAAMASSSSDTTDGVEPTTVCRFCVSDKCQTSSYLCPRCNAPYCSLACYKSEKHLRCTEQFHRAAVTEELKIRDAENKVATSSAKISASGERTFAAPVERMFSAARASEDECSSDDDYLDTVASEMKGKSKELDAIDETDLDLQLMRLGVGMETSSLLNALSRKERALFEELFDENTSTSASFGESVFKKK